MYWMQTYSGFQFSYADGPRVIDIIDIAKSLSRQPRFLGHSKHFLSVAEHSVVMADYFADQQLSSRQQLLGLLHDAHEAYLGDMPRPLAEFLAKYHGVDMDAIKRDIDHSILNNLQIEPPNDEERALIKQADTFLLTAERRLAMPSALPWHVDDVIIPEFLTGAYGFWEPDLAMVYFERAFRELIEGAKVEARIEV